MRRRNVTLLEILYCDGLIKMTGEKCPTTLGVQPDSGRHSGPLRGFADTEMILSNITSGEGIVRYKDLEDRENVPSTVPPTKTPTDSQQ